MVKWKRDLILSITLMVVSAVLFWYAGTFTTDVIKIKAAMPDVYMRLWLGLLFVLAVALLVRTFIEKPAEIQGKMWGKLQIFTVGCVFLYILLLKWIGFRIMTAAFIFALTSVYCLSCMEEKPKGKKLAIQLGKWLLIGVITTAACDVLFRQVLSCNLPSFSLF